MSLILATAGKHLALSCQLSAVSHQLCSLFPVPKAYPRFPYKRGTLSLRSVPHTSHKRYIGLSCSRLPRCA
ncbi:hypothetical protein, partial [Moorena sp. SIO2C4]|uniref:hypothetical protein n=1 Tax=Moorena sp. SIO2C4 TaxID=2607824 RepID=UPI002579EB01